MHPSIYWIPDARSRLAILARPRPADWLADDVACWHSAGIDVVVSMLTDHEIAELGVDTEPEACRAAGMQFLSFPIQDRGVPASRAPFTNLVDDLRARHRAGHSIGVHCRMGIGRSSLLLAALLVRSGTSPEDAFQLISAARGLPVPDTDEQRQWLLCGTLRPMAEE